jgi:hypothetical protein
MRSNTTPMLTRGGAHVLYARQLYARRVITIRQMVAMACAGAADTPPPEPSPEWLALAERAGLTQAEREIAARSSEVK